MNNKSWIADKLRLGTAYYPEHWDKALWADDLLRMQEHGISVLRIGDFAWSKYEYQEGKFTLGYYDDFLRLCTEKGMQVIFCTPTAAPPEWMVCQYPEILNTSAEGRVYRGDRRFCSYNSPVYRKFCARLVEKLAEHYGKWDCIVSWQIDNELNCDLAEFYSEADNAAFRAYLKEKFGTLATLNDALGLTFWSRVYDDWSEIRLSKGGGVATASNPHMMLEQHRFFSESALDFCSMQAKLLRPYLLADKYITTNGLFGNLDYNRLMESGLDFITYDSYPNFAFDIANDPGKPGNLNDRKWCWNLMWSRSVSPIFGIMEQQAGANGWTTRMETPMPRPGQMRLWTMQSIAHGADIVSYFRWRTSPMGCEIYWHGLNDYANTDNRRLRELKAISADIERLQPLSKAVYKAKVAVLKDYDNAWDADADTWHGRVDRASDDAWFAAAQLTHTPCDFCYLRPETTVAELRRYDLLVYPHAAIMTPRVSALLRAYVEAGGTLILGARTGYKNETGLCPMRPMPGLVGEWCGVTVEDYTLVSPAEGEICADWAGRELPVPVFNEVLRSDAEAEVLARFTGSYYAGQPALCRKAVGAGKVYYLGGCFGVEMAKIILQETEVCDPYRKTITLPETVELAVRADENNEYLFVLNYQNTPAELCLQETLYELTTTQEVEGAVTLPAYGVEVFRR